VGFPLGSVKGAEVGTFVGAPGTYVGDRVGLEEGPTVGTAEGTGVGCPSLKVGDKVGDEVGALLGVDEGRGVGTPDLYVGLRVGWQYWSSSRSFQGACFEAFTVGEALGNGVGLPAT